MKRLECSFSAKIIAFFLLLIFGLTFIACAFGVGYLAYIGAYADGGENAVNDVLEDYVTVMAQKSVDYVDRVQNFDYYGTVADKEITELAEQFYYEKTNFFVTATDDETGDVLFENYTCKDSCFFAERKYSYIYKEPVFSVCTAYENYAERWAYVSACKETYDDVIYSAYDADADGDGDYECILDMRCYENTRKDITVNCGISSDMHARDRIYYRLFWVEKLVDLRNAALVIGISSCLVSLALLIFLICAAGKTDEKGTVALNFADKIPLDLYICIFAVPVVLSVLLFERLHGINNFFSVLTPVFCVFVIAVCLLAAVLSFATRIKVGKPFENTLIYIVICFIVRTLLKFFRHIPTVRKAALLSAGISVFSVFLGVLSENGLVFLFSVIMSAALSYFIIENAVRLNNIRKVGKMMANGDTDVRVNTENMYGNIKDFADDLNNIGGGISKAVEERTRSEHFKTELITNVSHDIKTPLTSIINYIDLLKKEESGNERITEYVSVLDRQSSRLKKLIEDLVEASKASTGNLTVTFEALDVGVLLDQVIGEYAEKLAANKLCAVTDVKGADLHILADGRHSWRVFDNLMSNICKYSQPDTRVYVTAEKVDGFVTVTLKNVSRLPLNLSGEELMERFVRGDSSRNTEGSGLGLSIAKSLTELQNGKFDILVDGDLFKVTVTFKSL